MDIIERNQLYKDARITFCGDLVPMHTIKKCAILQQAICRHVTGGQSSEAVIESLAEVEIQLEQMRILFDSDLIEEAKQRKVHELRNLVDELNNREGASHE